MQQEKKEKILKAFKNNNQILGIYTFDENKNFLKISGDIDNKVLQEIEKIMKVFQSKIDADFISFNLENYLIIIFKYGSHQIVILGTSNLKEPLLRITIKSI